MNASDYYTYYAIQKYEHVNVSFSKKLRNYQKKRKHILKPVII